MANSPLVSVLIITMNHEKFIEQACRSVISQTYNNIEIIFLDNKSDDKTFELGKAALTKSNIPFTAIENTERFGVAKNLNILVSHASGDYISILSGDDWYTDNSIEEKVKFIQEKNVDFALSDGYKYLQNEDRLIDAYSLKTKEKIINSIPNFFHENVTQNIPINVGVFVKKDLLKEYPFDENIHAEDWDMNLRLTSLGYRIGFIDKKLFYYRILSNSLSTNWVLMEDAFQKITKKYIEYINADNKLKKKYTVNLLKHKYGVKLSLAKSEKEKRKITKEWKREKYKAKYTQPILFFKLLFLK
ncbi:Glycosyltransferase involved in cell wall bisynthesis [Chryseobacterium arachidis]|uniref:Glycosyltransferase involved in cell wall bisynthesis n=1 Tax=Chryseobacterium arachidis TaxID=1416778 RepID=A0A1M5ITK2_9FLAO|nr:glycosyltransferase [Chryseobacterium arachidis]SHG31654.1 Glycosyltransferase involved in cell wall bisynthesis [Chryseobacterium arachidis]